jgi:hypothetical protein
MGFLYKAIFVPLLPWIKYKGAAQKRPGSFVRVALDMEVKYHSICGFSDAIWANYVAETKVFDTYLQIFESALNFLLLLLRDRKLEITSAVKNFFFFSFFSNNDHNIHIYTT